MTNIKQEPQASPPTALTDADINQITLDSIGKWPSFEAQSWACKVAHAVLSAISQPSEAEIRRKAASQEQQAPAMQELKCDFRSVDPAEWSDTFECSVCKQRYTYAAEDCMTAEILNKIVQCIHSATNSAPAQTGEKTK